MSKRRRHQRFSLGQPWEGRLRVLSEVSVLDIRDGHGLDVIAASPGVPGEVVALDLAGRGTVASLVVCVTDSRPMVVGGAVGHALHVLVLDETRYAEPGATATDERLATRGEVLEAPDVMGVLARETDVYVLNVSGSGCLIESASAVDAGTAGTLTLRVSDEPFGDAVRVTRCDRIEGAGSRYLLGAEFLWTTAPGAQSLRRVARDPRRTTVKPVEMMGIEPPLVM